jgi:hypothetical protein
MKTKTYTFRATQEESAALDSYCRKEGQTPSETIRMLIGEHILHFASMAPLNKKDDGPFTNNQSFKVGQKVQFWCTNKKDKFFGIHTVKKIRYDKINKVWGIQTDVSQKVAEPSNLFIAFHWFKPV